MATLRDISNRIVGVKSTAKITQAMRMVSAAKLRRAQSGIESARPYVLKLGEVLKNLVSVVGDDYSHPLIQNRDSVKHIAMIVVASDRGLCGSFNANLVRTATQYIDNDLKEQYPDAEVTVIPVGKRASGILLKDDNYHTPKHYDGIFNDLNFAASQDILSSIVSGYIDGSIDKVIVFFNEFKNLINQIPKHITLLPIEHEAGDEAAEEKFNVDYIYEPDQKEILDDLLPKHVDIQFWRTLLESNAAEHAARMIAMENATNNAKDLIKHLQLVFNKKRQEQITKEMLEIVSGAEALGN